MPGRHEGCDGRKHVRLLERVRLAGFGFGLVLFCFVLLVFVAFLCFPCFAVFVGGNVETRFSQPMTNSAPPPPPGPSVFHWLTATAGVEGGVLVVRIEGADSAPKDFHLPATGDRAGHHPHSVRDHLQEHSCGNGSWTGVRTHNALGWWLSDTFL